jgi:hypothetical protein
MMAKELPRTLSIEDAAALILNIDFLPGSNRLREMLSYFMEEAESNRDKARTYAERNKYEVMLVMHQYRFVLAKAVLDAIDAELDAINNGRDSILELEDDTFGSEQLVTSSVLSWAAHNGFGIRGWTAPRFWRKASERSFSTEYLDIIDDVIATFCEEGGMYYSPGKTPKKDAITLWVTEKYGSVSEKSLMLSAQSSVPA